jgi:hypothetical protein
LGDESEDKELLMPAGVHRRFHDPAEQIGRVLGDPLALEPLSPLPAARDPRSLIPAHAAGSSRTANLRAHRSAIPAPDEVFPAWRRAQLAVDRLSGEAPVAPGVLRTTGSCRPAGRRDRRVVHREAGGTHRRRRAVLPGARARDRTLSEIVRRGPSVGGLGVRVHHVRDESEPYGHAAELCAELREHRSMTLTTIAAEAPHPLLGREEGGVVDQLRVVHDVFGHAALGLGFDPQSEYATWLQCRALFSRDGCGAAFCELVGATTTFIVTGEKPALRADPPPAELVAALNATVEISTT